MHKMDFASLVYSKCYIDSDKATVLARVPQPASWPPRTWTPSSQKRDGPQVQTAHLLGTDVSSSLPAILKPSGDTGEERAAGPKCVRASLF